MRSAPRLANRLPRAGFPATMKRMAGQTLSELRALLAAHGLAPQKRFGQNFLIDLNLMRKVVAAGEIGAADVVLEVGPGAGSMTEMLLETGATVIAVEIDRGLHELIARQLGDHPRLKLIHADVMETKNRLNPRVVEAIVEAAPGPGGARKLVANLPYQIATPLLMELLLGEPALERMVFAIQREVADRLSAGVGSDDYGPLAILTALFADVRVLEKLPPQVFWPAPQVHSSLVRLTPDPARLSDPVSARGLAAFVRVAFQQRRKTLRRIFKDAEGGRVLAAAETVGVSLEARPETISPADWQAWFAAAQRLADRP